MTCKTFSKVFRLRVVLPACVLILGVAGAFVMVATAPKAAKRTPVVAAPVVAVKSYARQSWPVRLQVMGTVIAAREISLEPQVSGKILGVSEAFVPGGFFDKDEEVLRIDPTDYQLSLNEVEAEVTDALYDLKVEQGHQNVASREWALLRKSSKATDTDAELALRKPHLEKAEADLAAARAKLEQARVDLQRTRITAPFPAMVAEKSVDIGATVSTGDGLATLVGTDECWVRVSVPVDRLQWITMPDSDHAGSQARISDNRGGDYAGEVIRLLPSLEDEGRMARVLVSVRDPFNLQNDPHRKPLLIGSYVNVVIDGGSLPDSYAIPREAFRDNSRIWVLLGDGTLDIRTVQPVWRDSERVYLKKGLEDEEQVVLSNISAPIEGMKLRAETSVATSDSEGGIDNG